MEFNTAAPPETMSYRSQVQQDSPANGSVTDENEKPVFFFDIDNCVSKISTTRDVN
jgi:pyrimidine and pyridine-specific 5'-nucleotidase